MPVRSIEKRGNRTQITVTGRLEFIDIEFIRDALQRSGRADNILVDLREAPECEALKLLVLAALLSATETSFEFSGLSSTNQRVLDDFFSSNEAA